MRITKPEFDLFTYAFCGDRNCFESKHLSNLAKIAEEEKWSSNDASARKLDILFYYIIKTFEIVSKQNKIVLDDKNEFSVFNTGLLSENGEEIFGYFLLNKKEDAQKWFFKGFAKESDRCFTYYKFNKPKVAKYDKDISEFHFDSSADIEFNTDHIFNDHWDDENRFPSEIKELGKQLMIYTIKSSFEIMKKKIKRNLRLAVPQYYDGKIMFLLPIKIPVKDDKIITMALAVEKTGNGNYRANTIFDIESAYKKARLINKPESNWLI